MSFVFNQLHQIVEDTTPLLNTYLPEQANQIFQSSKQKVNEKTLCIQLYGTYNAGKSTLVNVLLGKNKAVVGEIPTTDKVDEFNWNGYKLLDSPGVNAPIEHEEITLNKLKSVDLVVFVIRQDDQDVKDVYDRIFDCIADKKNVFVILNYNGLDPKTTGEGSVQLLIDQINKILLSEAEKRKFSLVDLNKQLCVLPINLKTALKGRLEDKALLLRHSGYEEFSSQFSEWVKSYDNELHFVEAIKNNLKQFLIEPLDHVFQEKMSLSSDRKMLSREIAQLEKQRNILLNHSTNQLRTIVLSKKKNLFTVLPGISDKAKLHLFFQQYISDIESDFNNWFTAQSNQIQKLAMSEKKISTSDLSLSNEENNQFADKMMSMGSELLKNETLVKDGIVSGLKLLRENKIAFKGRWVTTFDKWGGKIAPVITIAATLFDVYQAGKKEDEYNQKQKNAMMQLHQMIESISNDVTRDLIGAAEKIVNEAFQDVIQKYQDELIELNKNASSIEKHYSDLQSISNRLNGICIL